MARMPLHVSLLGFLPPRIDRDQGARLAALLPAPRKRKPAAMTDYTSRILTRMRRWVGKRIPHSRTILTMNAGTSPNNHHAMLRRFFSA